jgi:pimeloyl-ACP methyl ester carboxylesterase
MIHVFGNPRSRRLWIPITALIIGAWLPGCGPPREAADRNAADTNQSASADPKVASAKSSDGLEIRYESAGSGEPALVFVHGWSCDRSYWRAQVDHFAKSHRVIAIDLGGHGESALGRKDWTMAAFGKDVQAAVEAAGPQKVVLVGHSMGGPVIAEAAQLMPERVVALVMVDFFNEVDRRFGPKEREGFLAPMRADFPQATRAFVRQEMFVPRSDPKLADRIAGDMASGPPSVAISAMEQLLQYDQGKALARTKVPVRLINADKWPTDLAAARRHKPDIQLAVIPAVGHFLMMEDPEEFNRVLARSVQELTLAGTSSALSAAKGNNPVGWRLDCFGGAAPAQ